MFFMSYNRQIYHYSPLDNHIIPVKKEYDDSHECFDRVLFPVDVDLVREASRARIKSMTLCLTENCNMRCSYCVYSGKFPDMRSHTTSTMSESIAFDAVNWLKNHSMDSEHVHLFFFGGEPLLQIDLIRRIVIYANDVFGEDKITFTISTNGTLINTEVIDWLGLHQNINLCITLNGPEKVHNRQRKYAVHTNSWSDIINNLMLIKRLLGEEYLRQHVRYITNYANPSELESIHQWYVKNDLQSVRFFPLTLPPGDAIKKELGVLSSPQERVSFRQVLSKMVQDAKQNEMLPLYVTSNSSMTLQLHFRDLKRYNVVAHSGFCIPFHTRVMVDTQGRLYLCEKTENIASYGHVGKQELEYAKLENDLASIANKIDNLTRCRNCPAVRFCQICYICFLAKDSCSFDGNIYRREQIIHLTCQKMRETFRRELAFYASLMETVPDLMETLEKPLEPDPFVQERRREAVARTLSKENNGPV